VIVSPNNVGTTTDEHLHVGSKLVGLMAGTWQPTPPELEHLIDHLVGCIYCQVALGTLIAAQANANECEDCSTEAVQMLLSKLAEAIHEAPILDDVSAYIETLETLGEEKAHERFPTLAAHLEKCRTCQSDIEGTRVLLRQAIKTGLIAPLSADA